MSKKKEKDELNVLTRFLYSTRYPSVWLQNIRQIPRNIKWAFQRALHGFCEPDVWDMDNFILRVIPRMLRKLKETSHGHPANFTKEEWTKILDDMIYCFETGYDYIYDNEKYNEYYEEWIQGIERNVVDGHLEVKANDAIAEKYIARMKEVEKKGEQLIQKGFQLLAENVYYLWD